MNNDLNQLKDKSLWRTGKDDYKKFLSIKLSKKSNLVSFLFGILFTCVLVFPIACVVFQVIELYWFSRKSLLFFLAIAWGLLMICNGLSNYISIKMVKAYDKDGTYKEENIIVDNIDRSKPEGSCVALLDNNGLTINVYAKSNNLVSGYDYIIDDYESDYRNVSIFTKDVKKANKVMVNIKDNIGNIGTINCSVSDKSIGFINTLSGRNKHLSENIVTALQKKGHTVGDLNSCITSRVKEYGAGTRKGVAAAGVALIECTYNMTGHTIPYNHTSGNLAYCPKAVVNDLCGKLGINTYWGTQGGMCRDGDAICYYGLNCASFVRWAFCNGGMDHCNTVSNGAGFNSSEFFKEMYGFKYTGGKITYRGTKDVTQGKSIIDLVSMLKPGDLISWSKPALTGASSAHVMLVVGNDGKNIYYAEDGDNIIKKSI